MLITAHPRVKPLADISLMPTISTDQRIVTVINVFTVDPASQRRLVELLSRATETLVRYASGFISASLHRSFDGTKVTMYAQWRTLEDYQAMRGHPAPAAYLEEALAIATFNSGTYEVVATWSPDASPY